MIFIDEHVLGWWVKLRAKLNDSRFYPILSYPRLIAVSCNYDGIQPLLFRLIFVIVSLTGSGCDISERPSIALLQWPTSTLHNEHLYLVTSVADMELFVVLTARLKLWRQSRRLVRSPIFTAKNLRNLKFGPKIHSILEYSAKKFLTLDNPLYQSVLKLLKLQVTNNIFLRRNYAI